MSAQFKGQVHLVNGEKMDGTFESYDAQEEAFVNAGQTDLIRWVKKGEDHEVPNVQLFPMTAIMRIVVEG